MIRIMQSGKISRNEILSRNNTLENDSIIASVRDIINQVSVNGDSAVLSYTEKFDGVKLENLKVTNDEIEAAWQRTDESLKQIVIKAKKNIEAFHKKQTSDSFFISENGIMLGQKSMPLEKAGVYVPGGTASYPSSVLMNVIPAKIAGVKKIIMVTPPGKNGLIADNILCAARIAEVDEIYKCGGAQAVAALAYGTQSISKVDKIVGPGNVFVAAAKRLVYGLVDIDMIAGPSEILVIADEGANARHVAADMLSQAEHDPLASAVLICTSLKMADEVAEEIEKQIKLLPRRQIAQESIANNGKIIVVKNLDEAVDIANSIAPEHLELCVNEPFALFDKVRNAGSVFMGYHAAEALGDYFAGPNHTLPTNGTARFSSPLSVYDFIKRSSFIYYTKNALNNVKDDVANFAHAEGLDAHAKSIKIRFEEDIK